MCQKIALLILLISLVACSTLDINNKQIEPAASAVTNDQVDKDTTAKLAVAPNSNGVATSKSDTADMATQPENVAPKAATTPVMTATQPGVATTTSPKLTERVVVNGQLVLALNMPYSQAWVKIKTALPAAGYPIMEQDNVAGTYYILDKIGSGNTIKRDTPIYQLQLHKSDSNKTTITINNAQNQPLANAVVERIFSALTNKLGL